MADILPTLEEVVVSSTRPPPPNRDTMQQFMRQDFLKSSQFIFRLPVVPFRNYDNIPLRDFSLFCESVEFPGKSLSTIDYKIPGKNRIKVPYTKEFPEVTCTFIHNIEVPLYDFFSTWINGITGFNSSTDNKYFDEITASFNLIQYTDMASSKFKKLTGLSGILNSIDTINKSFFDSSKLFNITDIGQTFINRVNNTQGTPPKAEYYNIEFVNAYPTSYASMPATWADDNYHRLTVTWSYEYYKINGVDPNTSVYW